VTKSLYYEKLRIEQTSLWKKRKPILGELDIELTERCNLNCIHCYINLPSDDFAAKQRELSTEDIKEILKEAASLGCLSVRFTGGEPLLRKDFEELYLFARRIGLKVLIFTNATLITPHLADLLSRIPPLEKIEVSLYGMKKKSYEAVTRVPGSFEAAWRGIKLLQEKKVPFVVKSALLPPNKGEIEEFEAWASTISWMERPQSYSMFFDLRCRRDSERRNNLIRNLRVSAEEAIEFLTRRPYEYLKEMREFCSKFMGPPDDKLFSCGAGIGGGCVDAYGQFQACMLLRHPNTVYELKKGSLDDATRNFFPRVRDMKATNPDYLARCARCFLKGLCEQCPAKSWMEHGTLDTPVEYLCEIAHAQARYLGLILEGEVAWEVEDWRERIRKFSEKNSTFQKIRRAKSYIYDG
jgi:radical SAM protein with 4Fe4S-binding SPASM domain